MCKYESEGNFKDFIPWYERQKSRKKKSYNSPDEKPESDHKEKCDDAFDKWEHTSEERLEEGYPMTVKTLMSRKSWNRDRENDEE